MNTHTLEADARCLSEALSTQEIASLCIRISDYFLRQYDKESTLLTYSQYSFGQCIRYITAIMSNILIMNGVGVGLRRKIQQIQVSMVRRLEKRHRYLYDAHNHVMSYGIEVTIHPKTVIDFIKRLTLESIKAAQLLNPDKADCLKGHRRTLVETVFPLMEAALSKLDTVPLDPESKFAFAMITFVTES